jgi:ribosome-dependent ATPase
MGALWPTTYYLDVSVGAFTKGLGFGALWPDVLTLAAFGPVLVAAAVLLLPRQER